MTTPAPQPKHARELTPRVIVLGLLLSVVMGAANVYVGLKAGMTVSASIPAAVMAMLVFRLLFKGSTIQEANQVQTAASAGESLAAGVIFTMPALVLIGFWSDFDFWTVTLVSFTGGMLGILFMIPMRRVFVVDNPDLPYPEGIACASVLEAGQEGASQGSAKALVIGGVFGGLFKLIGSFFGLISATLETAAVKGKSILYFGGDVSPMLVAVGLIVRLNVAALIFVGGALAWLVCLPIVGDGSAYTGDPVDGAYEIWSGEIRYIGVGAMVVAGIWSIVGVRRGLVEAVRELRAGLGKKPAAEASARDIPSKLILALLLSCLGLVALVYHGFTDSIGATLLSTVVMVIMAFFFTAVASYIVGLVGNTNSPVSGMTITTVLFTGGMLYLCGFRGMEGMVAVLGVAAVVCCVACTSGDVCNDLKTGSMVGAAPYRQQIMQILGVLVGCLTMGPVLSLLHNHTPGGIGGEELGAPQASLFASLAQGFFGEGQLPWNLILVGAGLGAAIIAADSVLKARGASFRAHAMPVAVGMYLPFGLSTPILVGGLIAWWATRACRTEEEVDRRLQRGVLFGSGVIAGEALMGVGIAALAAAGLERVDLGVSSTGVLIVSVVGAATAVGLFVAMTRARSEAS